MSIYADIPTATLRTWLFDALKARQTQLTGPSSASASDGRRVTFDRSKADLDAYIADLRRELERRGGGPSGPIVIAF